MATLNWLRLAANSVGERLLLKKQSLSGLDTGTVDYSIQSVYQADDYTNGTAGALNAAVTLSNLDNAASVTFQVTASVVGTLVAEISLDGTNWVTAPFILNYSTGVLAANVASGTTGIFIADTTGASAFRVRVSAYTSGTATVYMRAVPGEGLVSLLSTASTGSGTIDTGTQRVVLPTNQPEVPVGLVQSVTYRAATIALLAPAVTVAEPIFVITGSATKTIKVHRITASGATLTAVGYMNLACVKLSSAPTAGTTTALTKVPVDSNSAAATANLVQVYTAVPTGGRAIVGYLQSRRVLAQVGATPAAAGLVWPDVNFGPSNQNETQPWTLRGTAEGIALLFGVVSPAGPNLHVDCEWTEE